MEYKIDNEILTLYFPERIVYENADEVSKEIYSILKGKTISNIVIDLDNTEMLSSAGLRIILKLSKEYKVEVINVQSQVYDVFEMTGFTEMLSIKKGLRKISTDGAELIGEGFFSKVYKINKDTIVKEFIRDTPLSEISREFGLAKKAFILGIPTAITFDIVKINNHYGVVFELLNAGMLKDLFNSHPESYDTTMNMYANLVKTINTTKVNDESVPHQIDIHYKKCEVIKPFVEKEFYDRLIELSSTIEETNTFLHNDCHFKNIMVSNGELFLIDMETFSQGNPIFELEGLACSYLVFTEYDPVGQKEFFKMEPDLIYKVYKDLTRTYFKDISDEDYEENMLKVRALAYATVLFWIKKNMPDNLDYFNFCYKNAKETLYKIKDFRLKY